MHLTWFCNPNNRLCIGAGSLHLDQIWLKSDKIHPDQIRLESVNYII